MPLAADGGTCDRLHAMSIEGLQAAVVQLPAEKLDRFSQWFEEFLVEQWDFGSRPTSWPAGSTPPVVALTRTSRPAAALRSPRETLRYPGVRSRSPCRDITRGRAMPISIEALPVVSLDYTKRGPGLDVGLKQLER